MGHISINIHLFDIIFVSIAYTDTYDNVIDLYNRLELDVDATVLIQRSETPILALN